MKFYSFAYKSDAGLLYLLYSFYFWIEECIIYGFICRKESVFVRKRMVSLLKKVGTLDDISVQVSV